MFGAFLRLPLLIAMVCAALDYGGVPCFSELIPRTSRIRKTTVRNKLFVIENTLFALYQFLTRSLWVFRCDVHLTATKKGLNDCWPHIWIG